MNKSPNTCIKISVVDRKITCLKYLLIPRHSWLIWHPLSCSDPASARTWNWFSKNTARSRADELCSQHRRRDEAWTIPDIAGHVYYIPRFDPKLKIHGIGERFLACLLGDNLDLPPRTGERLEGTPRSLNESIVRIRLLFPGDLHSIQSAVSFKIPMPVCKKGRKQKK